MINLNERRFENKFRKHLHLQFFFIELFFKRNTRVVNQEPTAQEREKERRAFASCRKYSLRLLWGVKK